MSMRKDICNQTFGNLKVLEYSHTQKTHAYWKAQCLLCGKVISVSYSNLASGNTTACSGCNVIGLTREQRDDIVKRSEKKETVASIARAYDVKRGKIVSVLKKMKKE